VTPTSNPTLYNGRSGGSAGCCQSGGTGLQGAAAGEVVWLGSAAGQPRGQLLRVRPECGYAFENIPGVKSLQVFTQVDNLLNRAPPFAATPGGFNSSYGGTNPIFFDTLGLRYRIGFRMAF
jgi:hypothetical protein